MVTVPGVASEVVVAPEPVVGLVSELERAAARAVGSELVVEPDLEEED